MALKIRPLIAPAKVLELAPTPYVSNRKWVPELALFHSWALMQFGIEVTLDFLLAQKLNIHRIIADEWIAGLVYSGRAKQHRISVGSELDNEICAFELLPAAKQAVRMDASSVIVYDPWLHRDYDNLIGAARYPDLYIDKFYDIFVNEHYALFRKPRVREDGSTFMPISLNEHPRYVDRQTTEAFKDKTPPEEWRWRIDSFVSI